MNISRIMSSPLAMLAVVAIVVAGIGMVAATVPGVVSTTFAQDPATATPQPPTDAHAGGDSGDRHAGTGDGHGHSATHSNARTDLDAGADLDAGSHQHAAPHEFAGSHQHAAANIHASAC